MDHAGIVAELRIPNTYLAAIPRDIVCIIAEKLEHAPYKITLDQTLQPLCDARTKTVLASYSHVGSVVTCDTRYMDCRSSESGTQWLNLAGVWSGVTGIEVPTGEAFTCGSGIAIDKGDKTLYAEYPFDSTSWVEISEPPQLAAPWSIIDERVIDLHTYGYLCEVSLGRHYMIVLIGENGHLTSISIKNYTPNINCLAKCGDKWLVFSYIVTGKITYTSMSLHDKNGIQLGRVEQRSADLDPPYQLMSTDDPLCVLALYVESTFIKARTIRIVKLANATFGLPGTVARPH